MSTLKVTSIQNPSTSSGGVSIDTSGNVTLPRVSSLNGGQLAGMRNRIINGSMAISQRGTVTGIGGTNFPAYTLDRWLYDRTGLGTATISQGTNTDFGERNYLAAVSALAAGETLTIEQRIEASNCTDLAGQAVTVSYTVSGEDSTGAPFASSRCVLNYATAGVDNWATETQVGFFDFPVTGTATRITHTFNVPAAATNGLKLQFVVQKSGATGDVTINLGTVQLEPGPVATPFEHRPYGTELALCRRYYQRYSGSTGTGIGTFTRNAGNPTANGINFFGDVGMATVNSVTTKDFTVTDGPSNATQTGLTASVTGNAIVVNNISTTGLSAGLIRGRFGSASSFIAFDGEL